MNPITRVVELLEGLAKKVEADGKAEEELFDKYVCWYKTVVGTKTASNAAGEEGGGGRQGRGGTLRQVRLLVQDRRRHEDCLECGWRRRWRRTARPRRNSSTSTSAGTRPSSARRLPRMRLAKKVEADGKAEEELFDKYVCWYKTVVGTKTHSNAATTERQDLERRVADLNAELEKAKTLRTKEHEDFL